MRPRAQFASFLTGILLPFWAHAERQRPLPVEITVVDAEQQPLENAEVRISQAGDPAFSIVLRTDGRGKARQELPSRTATYRIAVSKDGYVPYRDEVALATMELKRGATLNLSYRLARRDSRAIYNEGVTALRSGDTKTALARFEEALAQQADFVEAMRAIYTVHLVEKRPQEALGTIDRLLALQPDDVDAVRARYEALEALGRTEEALAILERLVTLDRSSETARICFNVGATFWNRKQSAPARQWFEKAVELDPKLYQAHAALAEVWIANQDYPAALAALDRVLELAPRNFRAYERKIELLRALGRTEEAEATAKKLAELKSGS